MCKLIDVQTGSQNFKNVTDVANFSLETYRAGYLKFFVGVLKQCWRLLFCEFSVDHCDEKSSKPVIAFYYHKQ